MRYVYAIKHNGEIVYIGETGDPNERFRHHRTRSISKFKGLPIEMEILEEVDGDRRTSFHCQITWQKLLGFPVDAMENQRKRSMLGGRTSKPKHFPKNQ
jgi:hypothetical protein